MDGATCRDLGRVGSAGPTATSKRAVASTAPAELLPRVRASPVPIWRVTDLLARGELMEGYEHSAIVTRPVPRRRRWRRKRESEGGGGLTRVSVASEWQRCRKRPTFACMVSSVGKTAEATHHSPAKSSVVSTSPWGVHYRDIRFTTASARVEEPIVTSESVGAVGVGSRTTESAGHPYADRRRGRGGPPSSACGRPRARPKRPPNAVGFCKSYMALQSGFPRLPPDDPTATCPTTPRRAGRHRPRDSTLPARRGDHRSRLRSGGRRRAPASRAALALVSVASVLRETSAHRGGPPGPPPRGAVRNGPQAAGIRRP
jgi:hypothetical protein